MSLPVAVTAFSVVTAAGLGHDGMVEALTTHRGGLEPFEEPAGELRTCVGRVPATSDVRLPTALAAYDCRNNRLAELAITLDVFDARVADAVARFGAGRVGVVLGTSTSGIGAGEAAYARRDAAGRLPADFDFHHTHELSSLADYVRRRLALAGPAYTVSAACASSAKTFVDGAQLIAANVCDAVVVGGVDSLCDTSLRGFQALQLLSPEPCRPNDAARRGICIGEAGALALLERSGPENEDAPRLIGYGESTDAHHLASPHPEGVGAQLAMEEALERAAIRADAIDYVNMHGTGSHVNDWVEDGAVFRVLGARASCSSTKGWTGHTLGAAGAVEAAIALLAIGHGMVPGNLNLQTADPAFSCRFQRETEARPIRTVLSNSFGFGGNNCCLIFGRAGDVA